MKELIAVLVFLLSATTVSAEPVWHFANQRTVAWDASKPVDKDGKPAALPTGHIMEYHVFTVSADSPVKNGMVLNGKTKELKYTLSITQDT